MRRKFPSYRSYAKATMDVVLPQEERKGAVILEATDFRSSVLRNDGNGKFTVVALPVQAQLSVVNGIVVDDFDGDGNADIILNGNDYGTEPFVGRYDAMNGLYLKGDGKGGFVPLPIVESGIYIPGDGKSLVKLRSADGRCLLAAGQNRGPMKLFALKKKLKLAGLQPSDVRALIEYKSGRRRVAEVDYGSSFLSQSGRFLLLNDSVRSLEVVDSKGARRKISE